MLFQNNVFAQDAMCNGWVISSPYQFIVKRTGRNSFDLVVPEQPPDSDIVTLEMVGGDPAVFVNTLWSVDLPENKSALFTTPFIDDAIPPQTSPQHIDGDELPIDITAVLPVEDEFQVVAGQPITQLHVVPETFPEPSHRALTESEADEIHREKRSRRIYPERYDNKRFRPSPGSVTMIDE